MQAEPRRDSTAQALSESLTYEDWKLVFLKTVLRISVVVFGLAAILAAPTNTPATNILYVFLVLAIAAAAFARLSYAARAAVLLGGLMITATNLLLQLGTESEATMVFLAVIVLTALLFEQRYEYLVMGMVSAIILGAASAAISHRFILVPWMRLGEPNYSLVIGGWVEWIVYLTDVLFTSVLVCYAVRLLKRKFSSILKEAQHAIVDLSDARNELESRVHARTADLERATSQSEARAGHLQAIAEVSRTAVSIQLLDALLPTIVTQISQRFGYYHVAIYLIDARAEFAVLRAASSDGGQTLLARQHRLRVGQRGIVGLVAQSGRPRIALDVDRDSVFVQNTNLPETRSELALPLFGADRVIGVLDIQSQEARAFSEDDVSTLSILSDQMATSIQNARSFEQAQRALVETEATSRQLTHQAWSAFSRQREVRGYHFDGSAAEPMKASDGRRLPNAKSIPIKLRGEIIGSMKISSTLRAQELTDDEIAIAEATAERLALAVESARLLDEAQRRAAKERTIGEISAKIGGSVNIENILQTAVKELGTTLPDAEIAIHFKQDEGLA